MITIFLRSDIMATIFSLHILVWLLFEGGYYSKAATIRGRLLFEGGYYSRAATIRGRLLFEGGYYSRVATIQGRLLFEGGYYSRAATIQGRLLFKGGYYSRSAFIPRYPVQCATFTMYQRVQVPINNAYTQFPISSVGVMDSQVQVAPSICTNFTQTREHDGSTIS